MSEHNDIRRVAIDLSIVGSFAIGVICAIVTIVAYLAEASFWPLMLSIATVIIGTGYFAGRKTGTFDRFTASDAELRRASLRNEWRQWMILDRRGIGFVFMIGLVCIGCFVTVFEWILPDPPLGRSLRGIAGIAAGAITFVLVCYAVNWLDRLRGMTRLRRSISLDPECKKFFDRFASYDPVVIASRESAYQETSAPLCALLRGSVTVEFWCVAAEAIGYLGDHEAIAELERSDPEYPKLYFREDDDRVQQQSQQEIDVAMAKVHDARHKAISRILRRLEKQL